MTWAKVDDLFFGHPKVVQTSLAARGLWVTALSWASAFRTDGRIPDAILPTLLTEVTEDPEPLVEELVTRRLWERVHDGYVIHDFLDWNPSRDELDARRQASTARVAAHRERKRESNALQSHNGNALPSDPVTSLPARPGPSRPVSEREKRSLSRATQWPDDFTLSLERAEVAVTFGLDAATEWNKFHDHALKDGVTHKNWDAAWRYWCRRALEFQRRKMPWGT